MSFICDYVAQHIKMDHLGQEFKIDILLFSKWLFFWLNFGAFFFKSDIAFLRYGNLISLMTYQINEMSFDFEKKALEV